jgi:hypothetical protein
VLASDRLAEPRPSAGADVTHLRNKGGVGGPTLITQVLYDTFVGQGVDCVIFKATDKDHFTSGGVDNVTRLLKVENLPNRRFRFTLAAPFPEGTAPGRVSPSAR